MSATATADNADKVRALHDRLVAQVEALVTEEEWARYLSVAARFHTYSPNNLWLILAQRPDLAATGGRVAGFRTWRKLGRSVNRGAKGIAILAPCIYRRRGDDEPAQAQAPDDRGAPVAPVAVNGGAGVLRGFRVVYVFAESDTSGQPVPEVRPVLLEGEGALWDGLAAQVAAAGYSVARGDCGSANGCTNFAERTVTVAPHLSGQMADKTLTHDL